MTEWANIHLLFPDPAATDHPHNQQWQPTGPVEIVMQLPTGSRYHNGDGRYDDHDDAIGG